MSWVTELAGSEYTCSLKTLYACQFYWVYGTRPMPISLGRIIFCEFFFFGGKIDIQNFLYSRLINCFQHSKGEKSLLHPWLGFSFIQDNLDWREVCWLPRLPGQAAGSKFSEKSSRWPLGSMEVSQDFPGESLVGGSNYFGHTTSKVLTKSHLLSEFKAWGLSELYSTEDNGLTHTRETNSPQSQPGSCGITMTHFSWMKPWAKC